MNPMMNNIRAIPAIYCICCGEHHHNRMPFPRASYLAHKTTIFSTIINPKNANTIL
jgi:hypothetical protein